MHKKKDSRSKQLDGSKPTSDYVEDSSTHILDDYDPEIEYIPEMNYDNAIWIRGDEAAAYHQETLSKGYNFVQRRLTREGHKKGSGGWVYVPPKKI